MPMVTNTGQAGGVAASMDLVRLDKDERDLVPVVDDDDPPLHALISSADSSPPATAGDDGRIGANGLTGSACSLTVAAVASDVCWTTNCFKPRASWTSTEQPAPVVPGGSDPGRWRLDDRLFLKFEELDFGLRLRGCGWRVVIDPAMTLDMRTVHHRRGLGERIRFPHKRCRRGVATSPRGT